MKLLRCHIENFGKLSDFDLDFNENITTIMELNGWGKSTFATFIKSMFYGMEQSSKRNIRENEKKLYDPWQGGKYGGYIIFSVENKVYRLERYFGKSAKSDSFALYSEQTGLISNDYSENIGEELFKINKEAFERSTFIPQQQLSITSNLSINSKLTNLVEDNDDINNFDSAIARLDKRKKGLKGNGNSGEIPKIEDQIHKLERDILICTEAEQVSDRIKQEIKVKNEKMAQQLQKLQELKVALKDANEHEKVAAQKRLYDELCTNISNKANALESRAKFLNGKVPTQNDFDKYSAMIEKIKLANYTRDECGVDDKFMVEYNQLAEFFAEGEPKVEELDELSGVAGKYDACKASVVNTSFSDAEKLEKLQCYFEAGTPSEDDVAQCYDDLEKIGVLKTQISNKRTILDMSSSGGKSNLSIMLLIGAAILIGGIAAIALNMILGIMLAAVGLVIMIISFVSTQKNKKKDKDRAGALRAEIDSMEDECKGKTARVKEFIEKYSENSSVTNEISDLADIKTNIIAYKELRKRYDEFLACQAENKAKLEELEEKLEKSLGAFNRKIGSQSYSQVIKFVKSNLNRLAVLKEKYEKDLAAVKILEGVEPELQEFLRYYCVLVDSNYDKYLQEIKQITTDYLRLEKELKEAQVKKDEYEKQNDITFDEMPEQGDVKGLEKEIFEVEKSIDELKNDLDGANGLQGEYNKKMDIVEQKTEKESELERLELELDEKKKSYELIEKTMALLGEAKDNLSIGYMGKMNSGFKKYFDIINGEVFAKLKLATTLTLQIEEYGEQRDVECYSTGYRDLIGLCTRLALVDALFTEEKPFIILDDPFVNLDDDKLVRALDTIKNVSGTYQIIYLTCHSSRNAS